MARMPEELQRGRRRDPEGRRVGSLAGGLTPATGPAGPVEAKTLGCVFFVFSSGSGLVARTGREADMAMFVVLVCVCRLSL